MKRQKRIQGFTIACVVFIMWYAAIGDEPITRSKLDVRSETDILGRTGDAERAQAIAGKWYARKTRVTNSVGMELTLVPPGKFLMGSSISSKDTVRIFGGFKEHARFFENEHPQHTVEITRPFYLGTTEVTQSQWHQVMGTRPWQGRENIREGAQFPAVYISWHAAVSFCKKISALEGHSYRLPTEAEWEYTCRSGTNTNYSFGDDSTSLSAYAWWGGMDGNGNCDLESYPHMVMKKRPNEFGFYDMHGNAAEWCQDGFDYDYYYYLSSPPKDPTGPKNGVFRVSRGGAWSAPEVFQRSACRVPLVPTSQNPNCGFRVAVDLDTGIGQSLVPKKDR